MKRKAVMEYATRSKCERTVFLLGQLHVKIRERLEGWKGVFPRRCFPRKKNLAWVLEEKKGEMRWRFNNAKRRGWIELRRGRDGEVEDREEECANVSQI